jgi:L-lactate utilization protein LutB
MMAMDFDNMKMRAQLIRRNFIENMENFLLEFEEKVKKKGINVGWIPDEESLVQELIRLSEPVNYAKFFIDTQKLDIFGKMKHQKPHIKQITLEEFEANQNNPDFIVIKGDFGIAENGNILLFDSSIQNGINQLSHLIIILDINNLILKQEDLDLILFLKYGQSMTQDIKIINSKLQILRHDPIYSSLQQNNVDDIPITVLLYNNGITDLLKDNELRQILYCINCKKCKDCCPVYQITQIFSPKELVINFRKPDQIKSRTIFEHTTLCGNCDKICPVNIPLKELIIKEMIEANAYKGVGDKNSSLFKIFSKRTKMNKVNKGLRRYLFLQKFFGKNKMLYNYFSNQKDPFFNISQREEKKDEE